MSSPLLRLVFASVPLLLLGMNAPCLGGQPVVRNLKFPTIDAFESGTQASAVQRNSTGDGLVLYDVTLIEDDGPGIGSDADFLDAEQRAPTVLVSGDVRLKKILWVRQPAANSARLYVPEGLTVELNGVLIPGTADGKYREIPVSLLKRGDNQVVLSAPGKTRESVRIAPRSDILHSAPDRRALPNRPSAPAHSPYIGICQGLSQTPVVGEVLPEEWDSWTKWLHIRYMPRNNFFAQPTPVPLSQGLHWDWPDYFIVQDAQSPRYGCYRNFTARRSDVDSNLNQVRFAAEYGQKEGELEIQLGTVTPWFESFESQRDGAGWSAASAKFAWKLKAGANRLEMRARNTSGVTGPISSLQVVFASPTQ